MARSNDKDNVVPFPGTTVEAADGAESAALWLTRLNAGLDGDNRARLDAWLRESPRNAQALRDMAAFWDEQHLLAGLDLHDARPRRVAARGLRYAAAALVAAVGFGLVAYLREPSVPPQTAVVQYEQTFTTAVGERSTQTLPDGSVITLNTNTELHVVYHERDRVVQLLRGEAHFAVAHNTSRPFGVRAGGHIVHAVGTAFNVRLQQAGAAEVTVTEGVVQILDATQAPAAAQASDDWWSRPALRSGLVPGQLALLTEETGSAALAEVRQLNPDALEIRLAWQEGSLIFESEQLSVVLAEFSRYNAVEFVLDEARLGDVRVDMHFDADDVDGLLEALSEDFQIEAERVSAERIVLRQD
jgi:transmembrane sensor